MKKFLIALAVACCMNGSATADTILVSDNFDGQTDGTVLGGSQGWNAKWQGGSDQQNLYTFQGDTLQLDTSVASINYHALNGTAITSMAGETITISAEFRYTHLAGGNITANFNKNAFGLMTSTTSTWWNGDNKTSSLTNRGGAIGTSVPAAPWIESWITHSSLGVNTTNGGTSDWIRLEWELEDTGAAVMATQRVYRVDNNSLVSTATPVTYDSGIASGSTFYAGVSTGWNDVGGTVQSVANFSSVDVDNFQVTTTAVPEPTSALLLAGGLCGVVLRRRKCA